MASFQAKANPGANPQSLPAVRWCRAHMMQQQWYRVIVDLPTQKGLRGHQRRLGINDAKLAYGKWADRWKGCTLDQLVASLNRGQYYDCVHYEGIHGSLLAIRNGNSALTLQSNKLFSLQISVTTDQLLPAHCSGSPTRGLTAFYQRL